MTGKNLLFLLLFIPLMSIGQSYEELMGIDSKEKFVRTMVEIGFERVNSEEGMIAYAYKPTYSDNEETKSTLWAYHYGQEGLGGLVYLDITTKDFFGSEEDNKYNKIFDVAKDKCEYSQLLQNPIDVDDEMVSYGCDWNDSNRKIAFSKKDGQGFIVYAYSNED